MESKQVNIINTIIFSLIFGGMGSFIIIGMGIFLLKNITSNSVNLKLFIDVISIALILYSVINFYDWIKSKEISKFIVGLVSSEAALISYIMFNTYLV